MNTYQVVLATDGNETYVLFLYRDIQWTDLGAVAGLNGPSGALNLVTEAGPLALVNSTNIGVPGAFYFRVDGLIREPPGSVVCMAA